MILNPTRSNVPHICVTSVTKSQISLQFALRPGIFELKVILRHEHQMIPKMTMSHTMPKVPHVCVNSIHESQISLRFALRPAIFEIQAILRQMQRHFETSVPNDPKMTLNPTRSNDPQMIPINVLAIFTSHKFYSILLYNQLFWDVGHFETSVLNNPKITLYPTYPIYVSVVSTSPKFQSVMLYNQPFLRYRPFWTTAPNDPKMTLNPTRSKIGHVCVTSIRQSQISLRFALRPPFSRYHTFYNSPLSSMLNRPKRKKNAKNLTLVETLRGSLHMVPD